MQNHKNDPHKLFLEKLQEPLYYSFLAMYSEMPANTIKVSRLCERGGFHREKFYAHYHSLSDFIICFRRDFANDLNIFFTDLGSNGYSLPLNTYKAITYLENFQKIFAISYLKRNLTPYRILAEAAKPFIFKAWGIAPMNTNTLQSSHFTYLPTVQNTQSLVELEYHAFIFDTMEIFTRWMAQQQGNHKKASIVATQITDLIIYYGREYKRKKRGA